MARRRCRSSSCCCRRASSFSFSASASIRCSASIDWARELVWYWLAILSISSSNKSARSSAIDPACWPPPPPPLWLRVWTCVSYSSSACCRYWSAFCSDGSAPSGLRCCSLVSAAFISSTASGSTSAIFWKLGSGATSREFMRLTRPSTCSRRRPCDSASTTEFSRSFSGESVRFSRTVLKVAAMIWRCASDSAPTSAPPPPPPPPPPPAIEVAGLKSLPKGRMRRKYMSLVACLPPPLSLSAARA